MFFVVNVTGTVELTVSVDNLADFDATNVVEEALSSGTVIVDNVEAVSGAVQLVRANVAATEEVDASDLESTDAETLLDAALGWDVDADVISASMDVVSGPPGFEAVEKEYGRDIALGVYATLSSNGFDVI